MPFYVELGRIAGERLRELPHEIRQRWEISIAPVLRDNPRPRAAADFYILDLWNAWERHVYVLYSDAWPGLEVRYTVDPDDPREYADVPDEYEGAVYVYDIVPRGRGG